MKFGLSLPCVQPIGSPPWTDEAVVDGIEAVALKADALGYDHVTCCDHAVVPKSYAPTMGVRWFDALSTLSFVGGITSRVRLLTSVMVLPYRSPHDVAKAFGTLDALTDGRVILGVGVGHLKPEFRTLQANYEERGAVTDEYMEIVRALWSRDAATYHGKFWSFDELMIAPTPAKGPPPMWVGGNGRLAAERAGRLGDGWHPYNVTPEAFETGVDQAKEAAVRAGREPSALAFNAPVGSVDSSAPAEEACRRIEQWRDAGATSAYVGMRHEELSHVLEAMDWLAAEVMPEFT